MEKIICLIESDSDESIILLENKDIDKETKTKIKRELSFETQSNVSLVSKKVKHPNEIGVKTLHSLSLNKETKRNSKTMSVNDFYSSDIKLDRRLYFNRIDFDENFDINVYISSELEVIIDLVCSKSILYTTEHCYHLKLKRKKFEENNLIFQKMHQEYNDVFIKESSLVSESEEFILFKRYFENHLKNQEFVCRFLQQDYKNFVNFIKETYDNKIILP